MKVLLNILLVLTALGSLAQGSYAPSVGEVGCDAIHKDSSLIISWASQCSVNRGFLNITDKSLGLTSVGDSTKPIGIADNFVLSLGDSGVATVQFDGVLFNGLGPDFAVFENGFDNFFLELAFVEVSSDGSNFYRFPSNSLTDTTNQVNSFDSLDATNLNNLAGKFRGFYGVPFDLEEMEGIVGLNVNRVSHVRIVDVVGSMNSNYSTRDHIGRKVNDPFPTAFPSGGFDLDAVGAIYLTPTSIKKQEIKKLSFYPNPSQGEIYLTPEFNGKTAHLIAIDGRKIKTVTIKNNKLEFSNQKAGIYTLIIEFNDRALKAKLIIQ